MPESINVNKLKKTLWSQEKMPETAALYEECIGSTIGELADEIQNLAAAVVPNPSVSFRIKHPETLQKKIKLKNVQSIFSVDDVYGIRIVVESADDVYTVLEKIWQTFPGYLDHDYIKEPKVRLSEPNKGKMLRLLQFVGYKNEMPFEIQITTNAFNQENESLHDEYHRRKYSA